MLNCFLRIKKNGIVYDLEQNKKMFFYTDKNNKISESIKEIILKENDVILVIKNMFDETEVFGEDVYFNLFFTFEVIHSEKDVQHLLLKDIEQDKWTRTSERKNISKKASVSLEKTFLDEDNKITVDLIDISNGGCSFIIPAMYFSQIEKIRSIKIDNKEQDIIVRNNTFDNDCLILGVEFKNS